MFHCWKCLCDLSLLRYWAGGHSAWLRLGSLKKHCLGGRGQWRAAHRTLLSRRKLPTWALGQKRGVSPPFSLKYIGCVCWRGGSTFVLVTTDGDRPRVTTCVSSTPRERWVCLGLSLERWFLDLSATWNCLGSFTEYDVWCHPGIPSSLVWGAASALEYVKIQRAVSRVARFGPRV